MRADVGNFSFSFDESAVRAYKNKDAFVSEMKSGKEGVIEGDLDQIFGEIYDTICPPKEKKSK